MKRKSPGHYRYGEVPEDNRKSGTYEVIKGKELNENGRSYKGFKGVMASKWFVMRIYHAETPRLAGPVKTDIEDYFDSKKEAEKHLDRKIGNKVE